MSNRARLGLWRFMIPLPERFWQGQISKGAKGAEERILAFLTEERHLVRDFVVREIPRVGEPLSPEFIGQELNLPVDQVNTILDVLEKGLFFLFRNDQRAVEWAYPVTAHQTPHRLTFSTGEEGYAA